MSHKKVMLVFILVFGLSLLSISAFAQGEDLGERVTIYPWEIWDGEITVSTDDTVVLGARWGACTKGLAQAWTRTSYINYTINGEPLFSSQKEAREYWGRPYPVMNLEPDNCVNGSETIWIVAWEYELGLNEGDYQVHFEMGTTHPFHDGFDSDGDGKPDPQVFDIQFDFEIIVIEAGAISGTVIEDGGGPLEGLDVVACSIEIPDICVGAMTDADGRYFIYPVPEGDYRVFVYPQDGWVEEYYLETPHWNDALPVEVFVEMNTPDIDFTLERGGLISGRVFESDGITPIPNIGVDVVEGGHGACTDENGYYMIGSLPFGTYDIVAGRDFCGVGGYVETIVENVTVTLEAPNVEELNFILERGGSISGRVTNDQNGEGIPGVWVDTCEEAVSSENMWGQFPFCGGDATDEEGYYTIPGLIPGNYRVHVWDPFWLGEFYNDASTFNDALLVPVVGGPDPLVIDFALTQAGTVSGMVFESDGITPIPNIGVDVAEGWHGACTDENGYYMIGSLPFGTYDIVAGRDFCGVGGYVETIVENVTVILEAPNVEELNFILERGGSISGRVTNDQNGEGIPGVWVDTCEEAVSSENMWGQFPFCGGDATDEEGYYTIPGLIPGNYRVHVWDPFWLGEFYNDASTFNDALLVPVVGGPDPLVIDFALTQAGTVSGMVFESDGINPIPNIGVDVVEGGHGACTDDNGYYMIGSLPFGTYDIVAGRDFCGEGGFAETIVVDISVSLAAPHVQNLDFNLDQAASISGRVIDTFGYEIVGIWVEVNDFYTYSWAGGAHTDADGYYSVSGLAQGDYRICIWDQSWVHQCYNRALPGAETLVALAPGEHRDDIGFTLTQAGSISGNVIDEYEIPIVGISVGACQYNEVDRVCYGNSTDNQGNFTLSGMIPDEYLVFIWDQEGWANQLFYQTQDFDLATPVLVVAGQDTGGIFFTLTPAVP